MTDSPSVRIDPVSLGQLECWRVRTPHGTALMARQGAQLLSYETADGRPVVWLSEDARFEHGVPVRGGVPVCWPWFGAYTRNPQAVRDAVGAPDNAPSHGLVRDLDWNLVEQHVRTDAAELIYTCDLSRGLGPWLHPAQLTLRARFGATVSLALSTHNTGTQPFTVSLALHTYLAVSDSRVIDVEGLNGLDYIDTARGWETHNQQGPVAIEEETDRIYLDVDRPIVVRDPRWRRTVAIRARHSRSAVVWNPWIDKAARLSDFPDDAWQRMLCVETARVMDDVLTVAPGATETVEMSIEVRAD